jgi:exopolyphosphatase/guanosine-5'-triphosphate,3'-diphosphate pyrophosphatase
LRVAVVDIGTNSTRLLVADVTDGEVEELERRSTVTRLGRGVDTTRTLSGEAIDAVCDAIAEYRNLWQELEAERVVAIATSAVRDARNSDAFNAELRERFDLTARTLDGTEEARLTYLGAVHGRTAVDGTLVIDIGGGSTELVLGHGEEMDFFTSLQAGVVRHTERHIRHDPPTPEELEALAGDVRGLLATALRDRYPTPRLGIGVAGTPTSLAAIDQGLEPYDPKRVHGYKLSLERIQRMFSLLAGKSLEERLKVRGLHAGRAPTIVAGVVILIQVMRAFGLQELEVSEHDILYGTALAATANGR